MAAAVRSTRRTSILWCFHAWCFLAVWGPSGVPRCLLVVARADLAVHVRGGEHGLGHAFPDVVDCLPALKSEETQAKLALFSPASGPASAELAWSCCTKWTAVVEPGAATVGPSAPGTSSQAAAGTIAIPLKHASPTTQSLSTAEPPIFGR